jgi:hypothetical protein
MENERYVRSGDCDFVGEREIVVRHDSKFRGEMSNDDVNVEKSFKVPENRNESDESDDSLDVK